MDFINFPVVALGAALICLIGVTIYAITQRGSLRSRDEQLVVARAQAYAMLELSQAGVLFLDREHKLMGEASASAPELLGHTCAAGTAFVQVIAELVDVIVRRETVAFLESMWKAEAAAQVDATQNPLARIHNGARHLALRFSRLVVDGRVHHIIVSIERISAPRLVPLTIEVPALNEETFAKRLAGETGTRPALNAAAMAALEPVAAESPIVATPAAPSLPAMSTGEFELGPLDVTEDSLPSVHPNGERNVATMAALAHVVGEASTANVDKTQRIQALSASLPSNVPTPDATTASMRRLDDGHHLATTITSPDVVQAASKPAAPVFDPAAIIDPPDPRLSEVLKEIMHIDAARLETFLAEAREKAGQLRAIIKLPAREPQAFREKLVLILELIRGIHARAERLPLPSVCERAERFEAALGQLRDKQSLSGNDFLPLAVKLDDLLSHLAIQGEVVTRLREWRTQNGESGYSIDVTQRSATATGTTIRQPQLRKAASAASTVSQPMSVAGKAARLSDLSQESLDEMAAFLADMYSKRVSLVVVGLEDVPRGYRRAIEKILGQLIHNAIRHGLETPADRVVMDKPEIGTVAVQFVRAGSDGYQLSVQDDGRGLDHDKIRAEAVRQGVFTAEVAAAMDSRKLASLIFRPGFTTVGNDGARGIGMDLVRDLVNKAGGRVGIATKAGEYTRFRITLPHEKKESNAAVA
ncbi:MAG TPA: ATP-binding protein [Steroidobacteraceae bacterium]|jgi:signal transduction histidine kinase|nr:ATP-binding protein [Steroidobacteraceae bacterium]